MIDKPKRPRGRPPGLQSSRTALAAGMEPQVLTTVLATEAIDAIEPGVVAAVETATQQANEIVAPSGEAPVQATEEGEIMATTADMTGESMAGAERARAMFGEMNERAKTAMEKSTKVVEDLVEFSKGNVEAVVASSRAAAKGTEALVQEVSDFGRKRFESASAAARGFAAAKSPTELLQLNSDYTRSAFDGLMAEASRMSEAYLKVMAEVMEPISGRFSLAAEKLKTAF